MYKKIGHDLYEGTSGKLNVYTNKDNYEKSKGGKICQCWGDTTDVPPSISVKSTVALNNDVDKGEKCKPDMVNSPPHYQSENGIECIEAIVAALGKEGAISYCRGNVIKYSWRIKNPNEDMAKAAWYSNKANELLNT